MDTRFKFLLSAGIVIAVIISTQYGNNGVSFLNIPADNDNNNDESENSNNEASSQSRTLRIGYFPNLNHAQAVLGLQQEGDFQRILNANKSNGNDGVKIKSFVFNAGPSAIEA